MTNVLKLENLVEGPFLKFVKHIFTRQLSVFILIFGRRESGKTDFALFLAEILYYTGIFKHIATNTRIYEAPFHIEYIICLDHLRKWCKETPGRKLFLFDELGKSARRRTPMKSLNIKIIDDMQILRKYKLSIIGITPNEKYADSTFLGSDLLDGFFTKPSYKNPKIAYYDDNLEYLHEEFYDIPKTSISFDTFDVAPFTEHSLQTPKFKDADKDLLWKWSNGGTVKQLDIHPMKLNRILRKYVKTTLESEVHTSQ